MKVAVNTRILIRNKLEGIGWYTYEVMQRLVDRHPDWEFLFLFDRPYDRSFVFGPNVTPLTVPPPARHPFLWYWWFNRSLPRVFRRHRPDVFFSPDGHCCLFDSVPTVMVTHDIAHVHFPEEVPWLVRRYYDYFTPRYLQRANRLLTVSSFSRQDISRYFHIPTEEITVTGNGVRHGFRPLSGEEKAAVRRKYAAGQEFFFFLGSVNPRKNVHRLIEAFDRFKTATGVAVHLVIGGASGWQTGAVRQAYDRATHRADISFLGYLEEEELSRVLGSALALTYFSLFEGFGLPLAEAMQAEVPVLASNSSSLPEVGGPAALYADPEDVDQMARLMRAVYSDPSLRRQLIEAGRRQLPRFSWEKTTQVVEAAIFEQGERSSNT